MLTLECLKDRFTVCKLRSLSDADLSREFCFLARTDGEISMLCPEACAPADTPAREDGWRGFRVRGCLDFSLIGVLAGIADVLSRAGISIFAVSTYDTDYIFTREASFAPALETLAAAGYDVRR